MTTEVVCQQLLPKGHELMQLQCGLVAIFTSHLQLLFRWIREPADSAKLAEDRIKIQLKQAQPQTRYFAQIYI